MSGPGRGSNSTTRIRLQEIKSKLCCLIDNTGDLSGLLSSILAALQSGKDYESALVVDANGDNWLEIRIYNEDTGTFDDPVYFQSGSNTPGTPVAPISYINPNTYLATLVTNTNSSTRTPNFIRVTSSGTISPLVYDFSVANVGTADGTILGSTIKPGETINFSAGALNNTYAAGTISYDGTGTELIIIYNS